MHAAKTIQLRQHCARRQRLAIKSYRVTALVDQLDFQRLIRRVFRRNRPTPHALVSGLGRVLQTAPLVGDVQQIGVHGVRRLATALIVHGNLVLLAKIHQRLAGIKIPLAPGRDHLNIGVQRIGPKLKAHLIVTLAGRTVGHRRRAGFAGNLYHALGDERPGDTRAQQILALVHRVSAEHGINIIGDKVLSEIFDVDLLHAHGLGLLPGRLHLFTLTNVSSKGHHLGVIGFLQPAANRGSVQPTRVGEDDFSLVRHGISFEQSGLEAAEILGQGGKGGKFGCAVPKLS